MISAQVQSQAIHEVCELFESFLNVRVEPSSDWENAEKLPEVVMAKVELNGEQNGAVLLICEPHTACFLAGAMLSTPPFPSLDADVRDAVGELTNILAGAIKPFLPFPARLSLPAVVTGGSASDVDTVGTRLNWRLPFVCQTAEGELLRNPIHGAKRLLLLCATR